jgi:hypothetical protein
MHIQQRALRTAVSCVALLIASTAVVADNFAYMGTVAGEFGTINLNTGVFSILGNSGQTLAGMAVTNGAIYASSYHTAGKLFTVNPTNGSVTLVGNSTSLVYDDFGSTTSGLYAIGTDAALYSINSITGAETYIGPTGLSFGSWRSLSTNSNTLYFANGPDLYTLNRNTGAPTLVGNMGGPQIGALLEEAGQLFGGTDLPTLKVATLNTTTGLATIGPALSGSSSPFYAIAPFPLPSAAGDYNHNGVIDAADYPVWLKGLGTVFTQNDYTVWRSHFGQTAGRGAGASVSPAVPEPTTLVMLITAMLAMCARRRTTMS